VVCHDYKTVLYKNSFFGLSNDSTFVQLSSGFYGFCAVLALSETTYNQQAQLETFKTICIYA
jgi:hypothetical protein